MLLVSMQLDYWKNNYFFLFNLKTPKAIPLIAKKSTPPSIGKPGGGGGPAEYATLQSNMVKKLMTYMFTFFFIKKRRG